MALWVIIIGFLIGLALAFSIGANDVANSFGTSVGSKVLTLRNACILGSVFETAGAVLMGSKVSSTISKGIIDVSMYDNDPGLLELGYLSSLIGGAAWLFLATMFKLPVSGTHSIVGAVLGFTLVAKGALGINWITMAKIASSWFISPMFSGAMSAGLYLILELVLLRMKNRRRQLERGLMLLPLFYAVTLTINAFSIFLEGPILGDIPIWGSLIMGAIVGLVAAIAAKFLVAPKIKRDIIRRQNDLKCAPVDKSTSIDDLLLQQTEQMMHANLDGDEKDELSVSKESKESEKKITLYVDDESVTEQTKLNENGKDVENVDEEREQTCGDKVKASKFCCTMPGKDHYDEEEDEWTVEEDPSVFQLFAFLQILTACFAAFAHGGNDVSNAVGPLLGLYRLYENEIGGGTPDTWILALGGGGISLGLWVLGRRVIETVGEDITKITPPSGFSIELGAATTVLIASHAKVPVSTTHCKIGSVIMVGISRGGRKQISWGIIRSIIGAWLITVPASAIVSAAVMFMFMYTVQDSLAASMSNYKMTGNVTMMPNETTAMFNETTTAIARFL